MKRRHFLVGAAGLAAVGVGATGVSLARMGSSSDYADATKAMRAVIPPHAQAHDFIRYATLAPNGHNTQPWQFSVAPGRITIRPDFSRRTVVVDPDDHHLFISLGCAAENLVLAAAARGYRGDALFDPMGAGSIDFAYGPAAKEASALFDAIPVRQSTRALFDGRAASLAVLRALSQAGTSADVDVALITDRTAMERVRQLVVTGNSAQMADPAFVRELKAWLRFNPRQALQAGDGLYSVASGNPALPDWLGPVAFDWLSTVQSQNDAYSRQIASSAGLALFTGARDDPAHWVAVGRACQRFALQATALGLKHAFINQPVEVAALRSDLAGIAGIPGRRPDILMRFGYGSSMPYSPRRPVAAVLRDSEV
ncbi:Acg family FMN-binding oxidoreductase [Sphingobium sp. Ant17]|uniref:Acg family FMN-binding oxidoreductase n=1 Tax=Sphingobium sp. Ant17 TaxID=1461752 RepID=UPI00044D9CC2|nr:nitroreductase family protein [Sphingobium sp. Ant17]EXS68840.1 Tat pathway signal protein [Sphingobium sp. Ant17]